MRPDMTLSVVGAIHPNADGGNRLFEIAMCAPRESVRLVPEPGNKHDPSAVTVYSTRNVQIGYLSAERCGWIGSKIRLGEEIRAVFQESVRGGALIRIGFSNTEPHLPLAHTKSEPRPVAEDGFYPDYIPPDD